jgi:4-hydroxythreonine-4-phosphate dehydrogenase
MSTFAFTCGDINGIGPEIVIQTLNKGITSKNKQVLFICPRNVFNDTIRVFKPTFKYEIVNKLPIKFNPKLVYILDIGSGRQNIGKETKDSGLISHKAILKACELAEDKIVDGIITAPISKMAFAKAGIKFPGHTELLADFFNVKKFVMMFVSNKMKAGLATIHIPIKDVPRSITKASLKNVINVVKDSLIIDFNISSPRIAVLGLNPHSGEQGKIGMEEGKIIKPVIDYFHKFIFGPMVPDAYFGTKSYKQFDCTIGLYHDQLLIPFKLLNFDKGVNYTAGLPIVRTSPDHGTAFDIAGRGAANPSSMIEAFNYAVKIVKNRKSYLAKH